MTPPPMILAILAVVTATFHPPQPTVGDPITIQFAAPTTLDASPDFEIVSRERNRVVVRTFAPKPFKVSGVTGGVRFTNLEIPVRSVIPPNDLGAPAPLVPPRKVAYPRGPSFAILIAALCAIAAWALLWKRTKKPVVVPEVVLTPAERFRRAVLALRYADRHPLRWAALADETRTFLAATREISPDLTTTEIVPRLERREAIVVDILRQGDLEKFSGRGAEPRDFEDVATRALELAS
jgi:hypothetical protein